MFHVILPLISKKMYSLLHWELEMKERIPQLSAVTQTLVEQTSCFVSSK